MKARRLLLAAVGILFLAGCLPIVSPGPEQSASCPAGGPCDPANETAATFSAGNGVTSSTVVIAYNGPGGFSWSWSQDGATWNPCGSTRPGCGGPGATVPNAPGAVFFLGDSAIAADPSQPQVVVATNLANSPNSTVADRVVASLSFDGGRTFRSTVQVADDDCANGRQDQQAMAFDPTTVPATLWVTWRHAGSDTYGACVRGGTVNVAMSRIDWLGPSQEVENLDRTPFYGVGGLTVQAGDQAVTVVYSNTDHAFFDGSSDKQVRWFSVTSFNNGIDWGPSHEIYDSHGFEWAIFNNQHVNALRAFGFARDLGGDYWVALQDSRESIRVFHSADLGSSWTQVANPRFPSRELLFPALAADSVGQVGLSFHVSDSSGNNYSRWFVGGQGSFDPTSWSLPRQISAVQAAPPGTPGGTSFQNTSLSRRLGDYDGMTAVDPTQFPSGGATFVPAWTTFDPTGAGLSTVSVAYVTVLEP